MKAGQFEAPEQSLQGSTVFGEIGTVWGRKDSPWSMDVNLRGYAGGKASAAWCSWRMPSESKREDLNSPLF